MDEINMDYNYRVWNNKIENAVEKWHYGFLKSHRTQRTLETYMQSSNKDLTKVRVGPPAWLNAQEKANWNHQLQLALRNCIAGIQLPAQQITLRKLWENLKSTIGKIENVKVLESMGWRISRGLKRGSNKIYNKEYVRTDVEINNNQGHQKIETTRKLVPRSPLPCPPPPPQPSLIPLQSRQRGATVETTRLPMEKPQIELEAPPFVELIRGEEFTPLKNVFEIYQAFKPTKDVAAVLAFGICGSKKKVMFLYRSLHKFLVWYEETERKSFKSGTYKNRKGKETKIYTWGEWKEVVRKGKCMMNREQASIIARLYQVQLRFFRYGEKNESRFVCTGQTAYLHHRVVNVLQLEANLWTLLQGTTAPVFKYDSDIGKFDTDFYLAGCNVQVNTAGKEKRKKEETEKTGRKSIDLVCQEQEKEKEFIATVGDRDVARRDRIASDASSSVLLSPASIERRLKAEKERKLSVSNISENDSDMQLSLELSPRMKDRTDSHITSSVLLSPASIERRLGIEQEKESLEVGKSEEGSDFRALFPSELLIVKPKKKKVSKREVWQKWRNLIRSRNKIAYKRYLIALAQEERRKDNQKSVFDYTAVKLSESEIDILSKGETFCPTTHEIDLDRLKTDIYQYNRKLRLHEQFRDKQVVERDVQQRGRRNTATTNRNNRTSVRRASTHTPTTTPTTGIITKQRHLPSTYDPLTQNRNLNRYTTCIQEECLLATKTKVSLRDNIHKHHRIALKTLKQKIDNKIIMITKADKGSGIVVCDYNTYVEKGTKYIEEEAGAYSRVADTEIDLIAKLTKQRNKVVDKLKKESVIPLHTATFCMKQVEGKITGMKFYFKIHKDQNVETTPVRPLQSCISAPTHHLSLVLTDILQPLLSTKNIPSFIYDSNHLLFRLQSLGTIPDNCTLISSDVSALYPSIPHEQGLEATQHFLTRCTQYNKTQIESLMQALKLVISENYVMWNNSIYKQISGVAMGTPVAVAYANIFMAWIDRIVGQKTNYIHEHIRFIDDNLFILPEERIDELMQVANNILPSIKYTHERLDKNSDRGLAFLDTQLFISQQGYIEARLYTKPTDRHAYLLPSSYHPPHIVKNIPSAVFKRLRRLCSKIEWYFEDAKKAKDWLQKRGYKEKEIDKACEKAAKADRWEMIEKIEASRGVTKTAVEETYKIPFIVTFNKFAKVFKQVLGKRQDLLDSSYKNSKVRPRVTFRRQRNLDDILIQKALRGPIRSINKEEWKFTKCGDRQQYRGTCPCKEMHEEGLCRCCAHASLEKISEEVKLRKKVDCNTKNVVYLIGCKKCDKRYVGETQQTVRDRLAQHLSNITKLNQPLYLHFRLVHSPRNLFITILETVQSTEQFFRKVREAWWINHLQTLEPKGFNAKLDCNQIYQESNR